MCDESLHTVKVPDLKTTYVSPVDVELVPRFFEIHDVGSDNDVTHDCKKGDLVAVAHGRWSRGFDIDHPEGKKMYALDPRDILGIWEGPRDVLEYATR